MGKILPFLTAFDPSDLPSASIDPLGFDRGYAYLAEKLLPGLTNVADRPRYFSILCAGALLAEDGFSGSQRELYAARSRTIQRLERLWALANVLATGPGEKLTSLRGVSYARAYAESLRVSAAIRAGTEFTLLRRQERYGAVGIYGSVAQTLRFWDRKSMQPTPDLGVPLAEEFLGSGRTPRAVKRAALSGDEVPLSTLRDWGEGVHIGGRYTKIERRCFRDALDRDATRARAAQALRALPPLEGETELARLTRLERALARDAAQADLFDASRAIQRFERTYRLAALGFERILWLTRHAPTGELGEADLSADPVLSAVAETLPSAVGELTAALDHAKSDSFHDAAGRLGDARTFLEDASRASSSLPELTDVLLARHADVQRGKFDRGRRKAPWLERVGGGIRMTFGRAGGLGQEATRPQDISPHPYRLSAADHLNRAAGR